MSEYIIIDGDILNFSSMFGANQVTPTGIATIKGSGEASIENKAICILGDEKKVSVSATYIKGTYTGGTGIITITSLAANQQATCATAATPVIVKGSQFNALFTVQTQAVDPNAGPDQVPTATGTGTFSNSQSFVKA